MCWEQRETDSDYFIFIFKKYSLGYSMREEKAAEGVRVLSTWLLSYRKKIKEIIKVGTKRNWKL